jgi:hypothetical protein
MALCLPLLVCAPACRRDAKAPPAPAAKQSVRAILAQVQGAVSVKRWRDYLVITPKAPTLTGSLFVLGILGYYFYHQVNSFNSKPYLFVESPAADEVVKERDLWVKGRTEEDAILRINGQDISVSGEGNFIQKITLSEGRNALVIEATNRFNRSDRRSLNIIYEKPYAPPQVTEVPVAPTAPTGTADALADTSKDSATSTGDPAQASTPSNPSKASPTKKPTPSPDTAQKTPVTTPPAPDISSPAASEPIPEEETVGEDGGTSADYINP